MSFWRKEDPVIEYPNGEDGQPIVVKGGMFSHQREWWDLPNFIRLLVGGYGSGKTNTLCKWSIAMALHNAPVPFGIVSPTFTMAKRTIVPTIANLLDGKQTIRQDLKWRLNKGDHEIYIDVECRPRATIMYFSGEDPDALKGPNLCGAGIDEPFIQHEDVFMQMNARCRDPRARLIAMGLTGTPEQLNWGYELAEGEMRGRYDVGYVIADTRLNKAVSKQYSLRLIKGLDPRAAEAYVQGRFVNLSKGRVFYQFDRERNVKEMPSGSGVHFAGMDFNVNPMAFCVGWHAGDRAHIYAEYELPNSDTQYACATIRDEHPKVRLVFPDPSGRRRSTSAPGGMSDFRWIQAAGFVVMSPTDQWPLRDSYNSVNAMLASGRLTIDPSCKRLIRYLSEYSHETIKQQAALSHLLDAMRYPITYLFPAFKKSTAVSKIVGA